MIFTPMVNVVPEGRSGNAVITHTEIGREGAKALNIGGWIADGTSPGVVPGKYCRLHIDKSIMMSDFPNERRTNTAVVRHAKGDVLIAGLGIGMILVPIAEKRFVRSITVVEKNPHVIALVEGPVKHYLRRTGVKIRVVEDDVHKMRLHRADRWNTIYFDIWPTITPVNLPEMVKLRRRYRGHLAQDGWCASWLEHALWKKLKEAVDDANLLAAVGGPIHEKDVDRLEAVKRLKELIKKARAA